MAVAAALNVVLSATTAQFQAKMSGAEARMKSMQKTSSATAAVMSRLKGGLAGLAAGFTINALATGFRNTVTAIDDAADAAERLGIAFQSFRAIQDASLAAGVDFEVISGALEKMNVNLGKARAGSKSTREALDRLGLSGLAFRDIGADESFLKIVSALRQVEDAGRRAAIIQELFGKNAREVGNIVAMTDDQFAKFYATSKNASAQMGGELVAAAQEAKQAVDNFERSWDRFAETLSTKVAPALTEVLNQTSSVIDNPMMLANPYAAYQSQAIAQAKEQAQIAEAKETAGLPTIDDRLYNAFGKAAEVFERLPAAGQKFVEVAENMKKHEEEVAQWARDRTTRLRNEQSSRDVGVFRALAGGVANYVKSEQEKRSQLTPAATAISAGSQADAMFSFQKQQENDQTKILKIDQQQVNLLQQLVTLGRAAAAVRVDEIGPF